MDESKIKTYDMNQKNRGIALILNFENFENDPDNKRKRIGSELDTKALEAAFSYLDFKIDVHNDLTESKLQDVIKFYAKRIYTDEDCFACAIMSHGNEHTIITSDNKQFKLRNIFKAIYNNRSLQEKPKLFFIQTCRTIKIELDDEEIKDNVFDYKDTYAEFTFFPIHCLRFFSPSEGYHSVINPNSGSILIQTLCTNLINYGQSKLFLESIIGEHWDSVLKAPIPIEKKQEQELAIRKYCELQHRLVKDIIFIKKE